MKCDTRPIAALAVLVTMLGCSAGGPDSPSGPPATTTPPGTSPTSPTIQVLPATYDFGKVTPGNVPAPLEVTIANTGNTALSVSSIGLRAPADPSFSVALNAGSKPCGGAASSIPAGDRCTVQVTFQPMSAGSFSTTLQINSNDRTSPVLAVTMGGAGEPVTTLTVRINQLQTSCPSNEVTAYVSVTDQGGYPVTGLQASNFGVTQEASSRPLLSLTYVDLAYKPIAIAAALDYSGSLTSQPVAFSDMKAGFANFFNSMRTGDAGEIVKFGSEVEVTQAFTSDKSSLAAAISAPFGTNSGTRLYDATHRATDDAAITSGTNRRAVIVATDGADNASAKSLAETSSNAIAKDVPVFTIGIGSSINKAVLEQMAATTGGQYFEANTSQNLATIHQQLSSILFKNQYVLKFDQLAKGVAGTSSNLSVQASSASTSGTGTAAIASCN